MLTGGFPFGRVITASSFVWLLAQYTVAGRRQPLSFYRCSRHRRHRRHRRRLCLVCPGCVLPRSRAPTLRRPCVWRIAAMRGAHGRHAKITCHHAILWLAMVHHNPIMGCSGAGKMPRPLLKGKKQHGKSTSTNTNRANRRAKRCRKCGRASACQIGQCRFGSGCKYRP